MHDPRLSNIYMRQDSLLQCMHIAAAKHWPPSISPIPLQCQTKLGFNFVEPLWYGRHGVSIPELKKSTNLKLILNILKIQCTNVEQKSDFCSTLLQYKFLAVEFRQSGCWLEGESRRSSLWKFARARHSVAVGAKASRSKIQKWSVTQTVNI